MKTEAPSSPKSETPSLSPDLTPLQIEAIHEIDKLLHPPTLSQFLNGSSRMGWAQLNLWMDSLKELLPVDPAQSPTQQPSPPTAN
jgi:hypothetical protein